jgi:hypothetical protein
MIKAHLNGGPVDDRYMDVERDVAYVAGLLPTIFSIEDEPSVRAPAFRQGQYRARRDSFGRMVPHNLAGVIEFDFEGWDI